MTINPRWIFTNRLSTKPPGVTLLISSVPTWLRGNKNTFFSTSSNMTRKPPEAKIQKGSQKFHKRKKTIHKFRPFQVLHPHQGLHCSLQVLQLRLNSSARISVAFCNSSFQEPDQKNKQKHLESFTGSSLKAYYAVSFIFF